MKLSTAPIPGDAIGLAKAFGQICETRIDGWGQIQSEKRDTLEAWRSAPIGPSSSNRSNDWPGEGYGPTGDWWAPANAAISDIAQRLNGNVGIVEREQAAVAKADRILRETLAAGTLSARIHSPHDPMGQPIADGYTAEWLVRGEYEPGFRNNYVREWREWRNGRRVVIPGMMPQQPGPPTDLNDDTLHPVFFDADEFKQWLQGAESAKPESNKLPGGARVIPMEPRNTATLECIRLALLETPPFNIGYVTCDWSWPKIADQIGDAYQQRMSARGFSKTEHKTPSVGSVRRVFDPEDG